MTESEWLTCTDPEPMLEFLKGKASDRKLRLFAVACCRRIWHLLKDDKSRDAVEIAEQFADGLVEVEQLKAASAKAASVGIGFGIQYSSANAAHFAALPGEVLGSRCAMFAARAVSDPGEPAVASEKQAQCHLLRDIFGNLFRPAPEWHSPYPLSLIDTYAERRFDDLSGLADTLEKAGCCRADILSHCREPGLHVRGCWAVDLILGKK